MSKTRVVGGLSVGVVAVALAFGGPVSPADAAAPAPGAQAAAGWLEAQLAKGPGFLPGPFDPTTPDWGLTEDAVLALTAAGHGEGTQARAATAEIASHVADFVTWDTFGKSYKGKVLLAGPVAKTMLVAQVQGADPTAFGKRDLDTDLRSLMATSGAQQGRFKDKNLVDTSPDADTSNGFSQALGVIALLRTSAGAPADAVAYLLHQQCPNGGFRLFYDTKASCTANGDADTDATALAVQALAALPSSAANHADVDAAMASAVGWLAGGQSATTGAVSSSGPSAAPNTNTTGLATLAWRLGGGSSTAADKGESYVAGLQVGGGATSGKNAGAIAYDKAAFTAAKNGAIGSSDLDQWRRATTQAIFGFNGMPSYATMAAVSAAPSPTSSSSSSTSSSSHPSSSHSSSHSAGHSSSSTGAPTVLGERLSASGDPGQLAATGGTPWGEVWLAAGLLLVGALLMRVRPRPARRH